MGGLGAGLSLGGAGGAGMAGCLGCGRGRLLAPSSLVSCRTCCTPPPLPGCWGGGRGGLSLLPPSSHLFRGASRSAQRRAGEETGNLRGSPPGEERRRWGPRCIRRGSHYEPGSWGEAPWTLMSCRGIGTRLLNFGNEGGPVLGGGGVGVSWRQSGKLRRGLVGGFRDDT